MASLFLDLSNHRWPDAPLGCIERIPRVVSQQVRYMAGDPLGAEPRPQHHRWRSPCSRANRPERELAEGVVRVGVKKREVGKENTETVDHKCHKIF